MKRRTTIVALLLMAVALAATYILLGPPPTKHAIRIVTPPSIIASLPIWVALDEGYFKDEFLDVELVNVSDSKLMVEALLADNADILPAVSLADLATTGGPGNLALMKVKIYSHSQMRKIPPFESLLVLPGSSISTLKDLENKKVAVYPGMTSELAMRHFLKAAGVNDSLVTYVKLPPPEHFPALAKNDVQAIHVYEPFRTASLDNGKTRELAGSIYASLTDPCAIGVSAVSRRLVREDKESAARYFKAWDKAIAFIRSEPVRSRKILADHLGMPEPLAAKATWVDATTVSETSFDILTLTVKMFQTAGVIPAEFILERDMVFTK